MMKKLAKRLSLIIIFLIFAANYYNLPFDITKPVFEAIETTKHSGHNILPSCAA